MRAIAIGVIVGLFGCGGSAPPPETFGQVCADVGEEWCARAIQCFPDGAPSHTSCVNDFVTGCCRDDGTCGNSVRDIDEDSWNRCLDGFPSLSCTDLADGDLPVACLSL